jgi:hypothetical protein
MAEQKIKGFHKNGSVLMPRLEINIPMPPGAAVPRAPQSQPIPVLPAQPARPAAAQSI